MGSQVVRAQAHTLGAVETHRAQIPFLQPIQSHDILLRLVQRFLVEGHRHSEDMGRTEQAVSVFLQPEYARAFVSCLVRTHTLEHAEAVVKRVSQHMHFGFTPGNHFSIHPD